MVTHDGEVVDKHLQAYNAAREMWRHQMSGRSPRSFDESFLLQKVNLESLPVNPEGNMR